MSDTSPSSQKSDIACHSCRKRKVKCDRAVPQCMVCESTSQVCSYPNGPLRPGPKIGSCKRTTKKRRRTTSEAHNEGLVSPSRCDDDPVGSRDSRNSLRRDSPMNAASSWDRTPPNEATSQQASPLAQGDEWNDSMFRSRPNPPDLSFILHPAHETATPGKESVSQPRTCTSNHDGPSNMDRAAISIGVPRPIVDEMIKLYFDNMVAINLFHEPTFLGKINSVDDTKCANALLAAMFAFASRFSGSSDIIGAYFGPTNLLKEHDHTSHFLDMALDYTDEALKLCGDEAPPLCLLQAYIITGHCQLTQGVLGKAWRTLGTCVRLAYELNLHLVDMQDPDLDEMSPAEWSEAEEKRRAWWAIWEMDVFATTIRRTPTSINWDQIETMLPVDDECWFKNEIKPSCYLKVDPILRWRALRDSGNRSPKAWFIVINSLMKDSQKISSPHGVRRQSHGAMPTQGASIAGQKLESLANAVQCFVLALPAHLRFRNQYLGFDARVSGRWHSLRQLHSCIYNIHLMTQLARLMIHRHAVFGNGSRLGQPRPRQNMGKRARQDENPRAKEANNMAMRQYFEAADNILTIVNRSCDDHIQFINPFLSYTIWLASAVQLVHRGLTRPGPQRDVAKSKFEVLHLTYKRCVEFWGIKEAVQRNLETVEAQLGTQQASSREEGKQPTRSSADSLSLELETESHTVGTSGNQHNPRWQSAQGYPPTPERSSIATTSLQEEPMNAGASHGLDCVEGTHPPAQQPGYLIPNTERIQTTQFPPVDSMHPPQSLDFSVGGFDSTGAEGCLDHFNSIGSEGYFDWANLELFNDIQDVLSGYTAY